MVASEVTKQTGIPFLSVLVRMSSISDPVFFACEPSDSVVKNLASTKTAATFSLTAPAMADINSLAALPSLHPWMRRTPLFLWHLTNTLKCSYGIDGVIANS